MTRVNVVPPSELLRAHLIAEYRELPRIFRLARDLPPGEAPDRYVLGSGHVRFFYDKLAWVAHRYRTLVDEMRRCGYAVNFPEPPKGPLHLYGEWTPDAQALALNRARIKERTR